MNTRITGTGYSLPAFRADNDYLATLVETNGSRRELESVPVIWQEKKRPYPWQRLLQRKL